MVEFMKGTFVAYKAKNKIHLGKFQRDVGKDEIVQFDGEVLKFQQQEIAYPEFRGAIAAGWFIPMDQPDSDYVPVSAGIRVRPAQGQDPSKKVTSMPVDTVTDDERVVGSVKKEAPSASSAPTISQEDRYVGPATKAGKEAAAKSEQATVRATPPEISVTKPKEMTPAQAYLEKERGKTASVSAPKEMVVPEATTSAPREMTVPKVTVSKVEAPPIEVPDPVAKPSQKEVDDVRPVGKVRTPAKQKTVVKNASEVARETSRLDNSPPPTAIGLEKRAQTPPKAVLSKESATGDVVVPVVSESLEGLLPEAARPPEVSKPIVASSLDEPKPAEPQPPADFEWEMKVRHWRTRVKEAIDKYSESPEILAKIKSLEPEMVWKHIAAGIAKKQGRLQSSSE